MSQRTSHSQNNPGGRTYSRREALKTGLMAAAAGTLSFPLGGRAQASDDPEETLVPFLDTPETPPHRLDWEGLTEWITPQDEVFNVEHYGIPDVSLDNHRLEITGLVKKPKALKLSEIKSMPSRDQLTTLECAGNGAFKGFSNAIYNSRWTGVPLGPLLEQCGLDSKAKEIVFIGADRQDETLREGTNRELTINVPFGRSMSAEEVMSRPLLLAYERNGSPIKKRNGAPLRLIVPGWYGIANVKWLSRIEVRDTRYMGRYMAREYVTVRGERRGDEVVYTETSVTRMNLKSAVARVTRQPTRNGRVPLKAYGAAWSDGTEISSVEVKLDDGEWRRAKLDAKPRAKYSWIFYSVELGAVKPGRHVVVSRATDVNGQVQPTASADEIALKKTYWEAYEQWPRSFEVEA